MYTLKFSHTSLFIVTFITKLLILNSVEGTVSYKNKDVLKVKLDPTRHQIADFFRLGHNLALGTVSNLKNYTFHGSNTKSSSCKKWQVGRVSRKQYEIINMLWRKTKGFKETETSTVKFYPTDPLYRIPSHMKSTSTTTSFIEFYYLDDYNNHKYYLLKDERIQRRTPVHIKRETADFPSFAFRVNKPNYARLAFSTKPSLTNDMETHYIKMPSLPVNILSNYVTLPKPDQKLFHKNTMENKVRSFINDDTYPTTETLNRSDQETTVKNSNTIEQKPIPTRSILTTAYDRIKFFEMYDKYTPFSYYGEREKRIDLNDIEISIHGNKSHDAFKNSLESVGKNQENNVTHKTKHAKKHIIDCNRNNELSTDKENINHNFILNLMSRKINITYPPATEVFSTSPRPKPFAINKISNVANWSDYSFMAAYIYEPSQVHCDAAGISPHWLVTSASCLSKRHNNPREGGRSALVAYCGSSWWSPDRIAYVKHSVVHPGYKERNEQSRYEYNIGLIEVVISMATCHGWAPVPLISHQFVGYSEGSKAYALGWGLDRYDTSFAANDLPNYPLMAYESRVFSNSCPGSFMHNETKYQRDKKSVKNLLCLLLPPYSSEDTDPIHGSMLLIEGKLCAVYLQEERRPFGNQSAQYTGIWRLGPWIHDMGRESEDTENFSF